ncbi:MAG TPA: Gfo/Idh/MocA family oxidoreductase, partial [Acidimicrobiia bacterium]
MNPRALGVAVIGTGFGARVVAPSFAAVEGVDVVSVVSARDDSAIAAAVADPRVELVSVHSPPFLHDRHVRIALEAGRSVLCDKPFTPSVSTSRALVADARDAPGVHLLNFEFRFDPVRERMREVVASGVLGAVEHVAWSHVSAGSRQPLRPYGWLFDAARGGGWIGAWASHAIDTLRVTVGEIEVVVASAPSLAVGSRPDPDDPDAPWRDCTAEDGLSALLRLAGGATVSIDSTFAAPASLPPRITIVGREAVLENVADARLTLFDAAGSRDAVRLPAREPGVDHHAAPMLVMAAAVRDAVRAGVAPAGLA